MNSSTQQALRLYERCILLGVGHCVSKEYTQQLERKPGIVSIEGRLTPTSNVMWLSQRIEQKMYSMEMF